MDLLNAILSWDDAGPVAILVLVVLMLAWLSRYLLRMIIADKDSQIARERHLTDKVTDEIGETLDAILESLRNLNEKGGPR